MDSVIDASISDDLVGGSPSVIAEAEAVVDELLDRLSQPYEFHVFPPGAVNYGLLLTYRQEWSPISYQVGRLAETIPLAPKERREVKVSTTRKVTENRKSLSSTTRESSRESTSTRKFETEAVEAATAAFSNQISSNGSFSIGVGSVGGSTQFSQNLTQDAKRTHKSFSEMARKAVDSLKEQVEVTVESTSEFTADSASTTTLENPNDELTVTYLLYELERRFRVLTELHRVRPVILVALPVPAPNEIDEEWLLRHSWILRENLLDETLIDALLGIEDAQSGAAFEYELRRVALVDQRQLTTKLLAEFLALEKLSSNREREIIAYMNGEADVEAGEKTTGQRVVAAIYTAGLSELWGGGQSNEDERLESRRKASEKALEFLEAEIGAKAATLSSARDALQRATDAFAEVAAEHARRRVATIRLRTHVRDNIFHYMHAIWAAEQPDQRFFALFDDEVPFHEPTPAAYQLAPGTTSLIGSLPGVIGDNTAVFDLTITAPDTANAPTTLRRLGDIADIDRPLGFRGNLVVFELRECSQLTDYMAAEYIDPHAGVTDPGSLSGISYDEFVDYLHAVAATGEITEDQLSVLVETAGALLDGQVDSSSELVLPTGQLFMEALPGDTSLLEPFKLAHRGLDVVVVEEEIRTLRLDALRRAGRIAASELERDPVEVDHFHLGETPGVVVSSQDS